MHKKQENCLQMQYLSIEMHLAKLKKEAAKLNYHIPIKPNPNIFQRIRKDRDSINP